MKSDVLIMGGGASGLMCAIAAKMSKPTDKVVILEKNERIGKKLLATGNGRCNLGNSNAKPENYHSVAGSASSFVKTALTKYSPADNEAFFHKLGLLVKTDEAGRQYPYTNQAASVLDILRLRADSLGVIVRTSTRVCRIKNRSPFTVLTDSESFTAQKLVLATGGIASPQISNAEGVADWMRNIGHNSSPLFPALTQIKTAGNLPKAMKGIRIPCAITLFTAGKAVQKEAGELLFADYGVSGIPAFQLSRQVSENFSHQEPQNQFLEIDTLPMLTVAEIADLLRERCQTIDTPLESFLTGIINKKLGLQVLKICGLSPLSRSCKQLTAEEIQKTAQTLKQLRLKVTGTTGWKNAQVTAGGLLTADFNPNTMESRIIPNLYAVGEALDIDGDCGGYNLTWCWSSARLAAENL